MPTPDAYVQLPFTTAPNDLADIAVEWLQNEWPGWVPDDGDMSVVLIEGIAPMAANAAQIAANMPPAALIALGTKLLGIPYQPGVQATATATFTVQDANGPYDIPTASEVDFGGFAFQTTADLTIPHGSTTGQVQVACNVATADANNLDGTGWTAANLPVYVTNMTLVANTTGGVDPQDDQDYLNSIAQVLQLRARSIITLVDFEIVAVNTQGISRAVAVAQGTNPRNIDVYVIDSAGNPVSSTIKTSLATQYGDTRMVNAVVTVNDASYTTVTVTYQLLALPGVDPVGLQASCNAALDNLLSPLEWGQPTGTTPGLSWVDQPVVHLNKIIGVLSAVPGVDYVESVVLFGDRVATLSSNLTSGGGGLTSLPINPAVNVIPSGYGVTLDDGAGHSQVWTTSGVTNIGATSIPVDLQAPNFSYPAATTKMASWVTGDLTMNANAAGALPKPGIMTGTIDVPST